MLADKRKLSADGKTSIGEIQGGVHTFDHLPVERGDSEDISAQAPKRRIIREVTSTKELDMQSLKNKGRFV